MKTFNRNLYSFSNSPFIQELYRNVNPRTLKLSTNQPASRAAFFLIRSDEGLALETSAIVSFTAFHYPHQHTVETPVCLPPRQRSQPSSFKSWHYTVSLESVFDWVFKVLQILLDKFKYSIVDSTCNLLIAVFSW